MILRYAQTTDAEAICSLINYYAERGLMLHRSMESAYSSLREFQVADDDDRQVVGCVAVDIFWADLAEVRSLAVREDYRGKGIGRELVKAAVAEARGLGIARIFTLTLEDDFFGRLDFSKVPKDSLPEKVWSDCVNCPKRDNCDEIAMVIGTGA